VDKYKQMKKLILGLTAIGIIIAAVILYACYNEKSDSTYLETQLRSSEINNFAIKMREGAIVHNEGLEYVYKELIILRPDSFEIFKVAELLTIDFINIHPFFESDVNAAINKAVIMFERSRDNSSKSDKLWFDDDDELLSNSQKTWLTRVNKAIDENSDLSQIIIELEIIKNSVIL